MAWLSNPGGLIHSRSLSAEGDEGDKRNLLGLAAPQNGEFSKPFHKLLQDLTRKYKLGSKS